MLTLSPVQQLMATPLPCKTKQHKCLYRPKLNEVSEIYDLLNEHLFNNKLVKPEIRIGRRRNVWGWCKGYWKKQESGSYCIILLSDKWYSIQWMISILAHEMVHQHTWDIGNYAMDHGPNFREHKTKLAEHDIILKRIINTKKWFKYQQFLRC